MEEVATAEFIKGIRGTDPVLSDGTPQIAFVGRSNVGKSSVINSLVGRKNLVKTSSMPGRTQEINIFLINNTRYFVDLPGYGFTRLSQKQTEKIQKMLLWYLTESAARPEKVVLIIDAHVGPTALDKEMLALLFENDHAPVVVANKIDKIGKSKQKSTLSRIEQELGVGAIPYSAKTKTGREELLSEVL